MRRQTRWQQYPGFRSSNSEWAACHDGESSTLYQCGILFRYQPSVMNIRVHWNQEVFKYGKRIVSGALLLLYPTGVFITCFNIDTILLQYGTHFCRSVGTIQCSTNSTPCARSLENWRSILFPSRSQQTVVPCIASSGKSLGTINNQNVSSENVTSCFGWQALGWGVCGWVGVRERVNARHAGLLNVALTTSIP